MELEKAKAPIVADGVQDILRAVESSMDENRARIPQEIWAFLNLFLCVSYNEFPKRLFQTSKRRFSCDRDSSRQRVPVLYPHSFPSIEPNQLEAVS